MSVECGDAARWGQRPHLNVLHRNLQETRACWVLSRKQSTLTSWISQVPLGSVNSSAQLVVRLPSWNDHAVCVMFSLPIL